MLLRHRLALLILVSVVIAVAFTLMGLSYNKFGAINVAWAQVYNLANGEGNGSLQTINQVGVRVIAPPLGSMLEIVEDGRTGVQFAPGDSKDLATKIHWAWTHERPMEVLSQSARAEFEAKYTAERNYSMLMDLYARVRPGKRGR